EALAARVAAALRGARATGRAVVPAADSNRAGHVSLDDPTPARSFGGRARAIARSHDRSPGGRALDGPRSGSAGRILLHAPDAEPQRGPPDDPGHCLRSRTQPRTDRPDAERPAGD